MENEIDHLINEFEDGKLTRRDLVRGLAAMSTAALATTILPEGSVAEAGSGTGGLKLWQQALLEGVANLHFKIPAGTNKPEIDGGEPFHGPGHWNWLFHEPQVSTDPDCLKSTTNNRIENAVKRVPKKGGATWDTEMPRSATQNVWGICNRMDDCRATDDDNLNSILFDLIQLKIKEAQFHIALVIWQNTNDAVFQKIIVDWGSVEYYDEAGREDEFRQKLIEHDRNNLLNSHSW